MANSSGLNDRPSRTSLRGVATLYQGSIPILLRSLHSREQVGCRLLQSWQIGVGDGLETATACVHSVADAVGDDNVARNSECLHVSLCLLKRAFNTCAQTLSFNDEVAVLWRTRQSVEYRYVDVAPLDG